VDDEAVNLAAHLPEIPGFKERYNETTKLAMTDRCRRDYRNRLVRIAEWFREHDPEYFAVGVRRVTDEELADETMFFYNTYKLDLHYKGMCHQRFLNFLVSNKRKPNGDLKSLIDIRKYKDAVYFGADIRNEKCSTIFQNSVKSFLEGYKKELNKDKKEGKVKDHAADPITLPVYKLLLKWAIEGNNLMVWFWTLCQWNFMARSASIDVRAKRNFKLGIDSIRGKYDDTKTDKAGERLSEKNLYANPFDWTMCWWTGVWIWFRVCIDEAAF